MQSAERSKQCPSFSQSIIIRIVYALENIFRDDLAFSPVEIICADTETFIPVVVYVTGIYVISRKFRPYLVYIIRTRDGDDRLAFELIQIQEKCRYQH